jgi:hypothetical protein
MTTTFQQSTSGTADLVAIDALGPAGAYRTPVREVIRDTAGAAQNAPAACFAAAGRTLQNR